MAATAWISSTITVSTVRSTSRAAEVSIRYSDSGVVIRMSGGSRRMAARSRCEVSPLRSATVGRRGNVIPASGARRLRSMSWLSAFSGETYSTRVPRSAGSRARPSSADRNAASVLPEPVGASSSVWLPAAIEGQPSCWARVGCSNVRSNQSRTGALKVVRGSLLTPAIYSRAPR